MKRSRVVIPQAPEDQAPNLEVSARERYSSFLIASIAIAGLLSGLLILLFFLNIDPPRRLQQIQVLDPLESFQLTNTNSTDDFEEPELSQSSGGWDVEGYTDAVSEAISKTPALAGLANEPGEGSGEIGKEPRRKRNRPSPRAEEKRHTRWALSFSLASKKEYLEQIDSLDIELGLLDKQEPRIDYARNVSTKTLLRNDLRKNEKRVYFSSRLPMTDRWNQSVFKESGLKTDDKFCLRFFPPEAIEQMTKLEIDYCKKNSLDPDQDLRQTLFGLNKTSKGWEIVLKKVRTN